MSCASRLQLQSEDVAKAAKTPTQDLSTSLDLDWDDKPTLQIPVNDFPVQYRKMMAHFDSNGDGIIDSADLTYAAKTFKRTRQQRRWLGWALGGAAVTCVLMVLATVGLVYGVMVATKDTVIVGDALVNKQTQDVVITRQAIAKYRLEDLPLLKPEQMEQLEKVQLNLPEGPMLLFRVTGFELVQDETVTIYTSPGHQLHIVNDKSVVLKYENGTTTTVWKAPENGRTRRELSLAGSTSTITTSLSNFGSFTGLLSGSSLELASGCRRPPCLLWP